MKDFNFSSRDVHKTIRTSQDVYDYIQVKCAGTSWNDKFNDAMLHLIYGVEVREEQLKKIDNQIEERKKTLQALDDVILQAKKSLGVNPYW